MTTTVLLFFLAAALVGVIGYAVGLGSGERLGDRHPRPDVAAIARTAADQRDRQARDAFERAIRQAVSRLQAATRSGGERGRARFAGTAAPPRGSLTDARRLAGEVEEKGARDRGALERIARSRPEQARSILGSGRSLCEALNGDRQVLAVPPFANVRLLQAQRRPGFGSD